MVYINELTVMGQEIKTWQDRQNDTYSNDKITFDNNDTDNNDKITFDKKMSLTTLTLTFTMTFDKMILITMNNEQ